MSERIPEGVHRLLESIGKGSLGMFQRLTPAGRHYFLAKFDHLLTDPEARKALYSIDYDRVPPDVDTFLDHADYLGGTGFELYPGWRPVLRAACAPGSRISECIFTGAQGRGKTSAAMVALVYKIIRLSCLRDPAVFYGLAPRTQIVFGLYMVTKKQLANTGFYMIRDQLIDNMAYFKDVFPRSPFGKENVLFSHGDKNIIISTSSKAWHVLGVSLFAVVADEMNYYDQGQATAESAREIVTECSSRLESRFLDEHGDIPGLAIFISQTRTEADFLEQRAQTMKGTAHVLVDRGPRWERGSPKPYKNLATDQARAGAKYLTETMVGKVPSFRVFRGSETAEPRILDNVAQQADGSWAVEPIDRADKPQDSLVIYPPVNHFKRFREDIYGALRLVADCPSNTANPFFPRREVIEAAFDSTLIHPCTMQTVRCYENQPGDFRLAEVFQHEKVTKVYMGRRAAIRHPEAPRYIHLDPASGGSGTHNWFGLAMVHPARFAVVERPNRPSDDYDPAEVGEGFVAKDVEVDFYIRLDAGPRGEPIDFKKVRRFIEWLRRVGFWVRKVTADGWQCLAAGTLVSTDRGIIPIEEVRTGDRVQSRSGARPVTKTWAFGRQPTLILRTQHGDRLEGTGRHRIEVLGGWDYGAEQRERKTLGSAGRVPVWVWRRFDEIRVGDVVRVWDRPTDLDAPPAVLAYSDPGELGKRVRGGPPSSIDSWAFPEKMTYELAEWLGLVWGDGHINEDSVVVTVEWEDVDDACAVFERLFGVPFLPHKGRDSSTVVGVSARWLTRWMALNGFVKPLIPSPIMRSGKNIRAAFLRGLFATDGSVKARDGQVSFSTIHYDLAQQVRIVLMEDWGIGSSLTTRSHDRDGCFVRDGSEHIVSIRGSRAQLMEAVGFSYTRKADRLAEHIARDGRRIFTKIESIEQGEAEVFDLSVDGDPSFLANGIVSHNSLETLQRLRDKGFIADGLSVDRTSKPYTLVRQVMNEARLAIPFPQGYGPERWGDSEQALRRVILFNELAGLEHDVDKDKVDHRDRNPDGSPGSKDIADALTGAAFTCLLDEVAPGDNPDAGSNGRRMVEERLGGFLGQDIVKKYLPGV